jgi:hypothetical protein
MGLVHIPNTIEWDWSTFQIRSDMWLIFGIYLFLTLVVGVCSVYLIRTTYSSLPRIRETHSKWSTSKRRIFIALDFFQCLVMTCAVCMIIYVSLSQWNHVSARTRMVLIGYFILMGGIFCTLCIILCMHLSVLFHSRPTTSIDSSNV